MHDANTPSSQTILLQKLKYACTQRALTYHFPEYLFKRINPYQQQAIIRQDILTLLRFLAPQLCIHYEKDCVTESYFTRDPFTSESTNVIWPEIMIIMGNNDLKQVDHAARICHQLAKIHHPIQAIYISGFGGHGVIRGSIFASTEAEAMAKYLENRGISRQQIFLERYAKNTGQNIQLTLALIKQNHPHVTHFLLSGTPAALLRQLRSFEKQVTSDSWNSVTILPPTLSEIDRIYHVSPLDTFVALFGALREMATFLEYFLTTDFLSKRELKDRHALEKSVQCLCTYYSKLTNQFVSAEKMLSLLLDEKSSNPARKEVSEMNQYFRLCFNLIEKEYMTEMPLECDKLTCDEALLNIQAAKLHWQEAQSKHQSYSQTVKALIDEPSLTSTKAHGLFTINKMCLKETNNMDHKAPSNKFPI